MSFALPIAKSTGKSQQEIPKSIDPVNHLPLFQPKVAIRACSESRPWNDATSVQRTTNQNKFPAFPVPDATGCHHLENADKSWIFWSRFATNYQGLLSLSKPPSLFFIFQGYSSKCTSNQPGKPPPNLSLAPPPTTNALPGCVSRKILDC